MTERYGRKKAKTQIQHVAVRRLHGAAGHPGAGEEGARALHPDSASGGDMQSLRALCGARHPRFRRGPFAA